MLGPRMVDLEHLGQNAGFDVNLLAVFRVCGVGREGGLAYGLSGKVGVSNGLENFACACCRCSRGESAQACDDEAAHIWVCLLLWPCSGANEGCLNSPLHTEVIASFSHAMRSAISFR